MTPSPPPRHRIAFLLSQLGSDASAGFERALGGLGITPGDAGVLRLVGRNPGVSQRAVSEQVGVGPSRIVAVLDRLEGKGLLERRRSPRDRRSHEVSLTEHGREVLERLGPIARDHERAYIEPLEPEEVHQLQSLLEKVATARQLSVEVHRGT
ncbi:MarR family winged helix-turn-helix transcriptional regulator [Brachybacterium halotolerans subsp. kimchii]|uniref:MarR family winged helix-turn-helix transcriptional regulator n=1 Tax=Brachybacterium halotolerans TaxID=2795215 RepID=UPI001E4EF2D6|nr:MarR family winged helix-turn-helix transcriptional regulator [Brachybacterium halotolerans]UEJ84313.1 MarR family winged helix-turn-helix transcriptional regulator [Brachybacterium halotolerans subsp. kimchii]